MTTQNFAPLYTGQNLLSVEEVLQPTTLTQLHAQLTEPGTPLAAQVQRLRQLKAFDAKAFAEAKRRLPFFCGSHFEGGHRHQRHFRSANWLVLDFDKLSEAGLNLAEVRERLWAEPTVAMLFASPGGDGLKAVFCLLEPCHDTTAYSAFYRYFAADFARRTQLDDVLDGVTCDVSRVCFLSHDPAASLREHPLRVDWRTPLEQEVDLFAAAAPAAGPTLTAAKTLPQPEALNAALLALNPERKSAPKPAPDVHPSLQRFATQVAQAAPAMQLVLLAERNLPYCKQFTFASGTFGAQVNVYFGKQGFKVVPTTLAGTSQPLTKAVAEWLSRLSYEAEMWTGRLTG